MSSGLRVAVWFVFDERHCKLNLRLHPCHLHLAAEAATALANAGYQKGTRVVLYCSVGYRSSNLANELVKQGLVDAADAFNLEGSIFEWANLGNEVVRGDEPATLVHPCVLGLGRVKSFARRHCLLRVT